MATTKTTNTSKTTTTKKKTSVPKQSKVEELKTAVDAEIIEDTKTDESTQNALAVLGQTTVTDIVNSVKTTAIMKPEDTKFLMDHSEHLGHVMEKTFMWRTDFQKLSIVNDIAHPTNHSKFHQAILEQKVQFDQTLYLAKDFEDKKLEVQELECDLEELQNDTTLSEKRKAIKARKITLNLQFAQYQLNNMKISMEYRMAEVRGWQTIEEDLINKMHAEGLSDEEIWQRDFGEIEELFFRSMNNLPGIQNSTDGGERNNLISIAIYAYEQARDANLLDSFKKKMGYTLTVAESVNFIENLLAEKANA